jgi:hypothetical protein
LRLVALAEGTPEEAAFQRALAERVGSPVCPPRDYAADLEQYKRVLADSGQPFEITHSNAGRVLVTEVGLILQSEDPTDPVIAEAVRYWRMLGKDPIAKAAFSDLIRYLEMRLQTRNQVPAHVVEKRFRDPLYNQRYKVMIRCPQTGGEVFTQMELRRHEFETTDIYKMRVESCPHCHAMHEWSKKDAFLGAPV